MRTAGRRLWSRRWTCVSRRWKRASTVEAMLEEEKKERKGETIGRRIRNFHSLSQRATITHNTRHTHTRTRTRTRTRTHTRALKVFPRRQPSFQTRCCALLLFQPHGLSLSPPVVTQASLGPALGALHHIHTHTHIDGSTHSHATSDTDKKAHIQTHPPPDSSEHTHTHRHTQTHRPPLACARALTRWSSPRLRCSRAGASSSR